MSSLNSPLFPIVEQQPSPQSEPPPEHRNELTDLEWDMRTGRAIHVLRSTLSSFFSTGLVSGSDAEKIESNLRGLLSLNRLEQKSTSSGNDAESIYSPKIKLVYTPPVALPAPFPRTLHVEGLPLYMASSVFVRHTLNAFYSNLHVELRKFIVNNGRGTRGSWPESDGETVEHETEKTIEKRDMRRREKSLFVALCVTGTTRVSGGASQWDVNSTYTFSPLTGLIHQHTINSIHPAPHQAVYDTLRASLGKVLGLGLTGSATAGRSGAGAGAACESVKKK